MVKISCSKSIFPKPAEILLSLEELGNVLQLQEAALLHHHL